MARTLESAPGRNSFLRSNIRTLLGGGILAIGVSSMPLFNDDRAEEGQNEEERRVLAEEDRLAQEKLDQLNQRGQEIVMSCRENVYHPSALLAQVEAQIMIDQMEPEWRDKGKTYTEGGLLPSVALKWLEAERRINELPPDLKDEAMNQYINGASFPEALERTLIDTLVKKDMKIEEAEDQAWLIGIKKGEWERVLSLLK